MENKLRNQHTTAKGNKRKRSGIIWGGVSLLVVFFTFYILMLPGITLQKDSFCGLDDHIHEQSCMLNETTLACFLSETGHAHGDDCMGEIASLSCALSETGAHAHDENCVSDKTVLACTETDDSTHSHGDDCYATEQANNCGLLESEGHSHDENCYADMPGIACGQQEAQPHTHTDACYATSTYLNCDDLPHQHTDACYLSDTSSGSAVGITQRDNDSHNNAAETSFTESGAVDMNGLIVHARTLGYQNGSWKESAYFTSGDEIKTYLSFFVPANSLSKTINTLEWQLPAELKIAQPLSGEITNDGLSAGYYQITTDGLIQLVIHDEIVSSGSGFDCTIVFDAALHGEGAIKFGALGAIIYISAGEGELSPASGMLQKSFVSVKNVKGTASALLNWGAQVTLPSQEDAPTSDLRYCGTVIGTNHWIDASAWSIAAYATDADGNESELELGTIIFYDSEGTVYTLAELLETPGIRITGFELMVGANKLDNVAGLRFTYNTCTGFAGLRPGETADFIVSGYASYGQYDCEAMASYRYKKQSALKLLNVGTDAQGEAVYTDDTLVLDYNTINNKIAYRLLVNTGKEQSGALSATVVLPAFAQLDYCEITVDGEGAQGSYTYEESTHSLVFAFEQNESNAAFAADIVLDIQHDSAWADEEHKNRVYYAKATMGETTCEAAQQVLRSEPVLTNDGEQIGILASYTVIVNAEGKALSADGNDLTLNSALTIDGEYEDAQILPESVQLSPYFADGKTPDSTSLMGDGGDALFQYDESAQNITLTVPDETPLQLTYSYKITTDEELELSSTAAISGTGIAATHTMTFNTLANENTVNITTQKVWEDANDAADKRPASIDVELLANGVSAGTITLSAAQSWTNTISMPFKDIDGNEIAYTMTEPTVAPGYSSSVAKSSSQGGSSGMTELTGDFQSGKTYMLVHKNPLNGGQIYAVGRKSTGGSTLNTERAWNENITANLAGYINGSIDIPETLLWTASPSSNSWPNFGYMLASKADNYTICMCDNDMDLIEPDNKCDKGGSAMHYDPLKYWIYDESEHGNMYLYFENNQDGREPEEYYAFDDKHTEFVVYELNTQPTINFIITNTYEAASVSVTKFWDHTGNTGTRPTQAVVTLYSNGTPAENQVVATLNGHDDTHTWSDLPIKDEEGNAISYTVQENQIANYKASPTSTEVDGEIRHTITNTYVPDGAKTNISVKKVWDHDGNNGNQPDSVTVQLYKNGQAEGAPVPLNNTNSNEYVWTDLPMKDSNGNVINYTVGEEDVPGYEAAITSTYTPGVNSTVGQWAQQSSLKLTNGGVYVFVYSYSGKQYALGKNSNETTLSLTSELNPNTSSPSMNIQWIAMEQGTNTGIFKLASKLFPDQYLRMGSSGNYASITKSLSSATSITFDGKIKNSSANLYLRGIGSSQYESTQSSDAARFTLYKLDVQTTTSNAQTSYTITNTYKPAVDIDLYKVSADDTPIPLGGAEFALYKFDSTAPAIIPGTADVPGTRVGGTYTSSSLDVNKGYATLSALGEGTYYLIETLAPDGYNKLNEPIVFTISQSGEVAITSGGAWATVATGANGPVLTVKNQRGYTLPETGGRGNRPYILAGLLTLALGLAVYHVYQRFKRAEGRCEPS